MRSRSIPPTKIHFCEEDRISILSQIEASLASGNIAAGKHVDELQARFAECAQSRHAIAVSSGGSALEACMRALDVRGREVIVPTNTFFATAASVVAAGGVVRLVDIDPRTAAPDCRQIRDAIGNKTAGVVMVHIGGMISPDISKISELCEERKVWLLEDCAHAPGSKLNGVHAGSFGIAGTFSFCATKIITCGEGGIVVTSDDGLANRIRLLRNYGKPEAWVTYSVEFGLNWRMNELAAIMASSQLARLDEFIAARARLAGIYTRIVEGREGLHHVAPFGRSSWYKYIVLLPPRTPRQDFKDRLAERGIRLAGGVYDIPLHKQPAMGQTLDDALFPGATYFCARHVCLPLYIGMTDEEATYVANEVIGAL